MVRRHVRSALRKRPAAMLQWDEQITLVGWDCDEKVADLSLHDRPRTNRRAVSSSRAFPYWSKAPSDETVIIRDRHARSRVYNGVRCADAREELPVEWVSAVPETTRP